MVEILKSLTIQELGEQFNLPKSTIRYWEKEFVEFICPNRTEGGQRRYTVRDAAIIETIRDLKKKGLSLAQIKAHLKVRQTAGKDYDPMILNALTDTIADAVRRELSHFLKGDI